MKLQKYFVKEREIDIKKASLEEKIDFLVEDYIPIQPYEIYFDMFRYFIKWIIGLGGLILLLLLHTDKISEIEILNLANSIYPLIDVFALMLVTSLILYLIYRLGYIYYSRKKK